MTVTIDTSAAEVIYGEIVPVGFTGKSRARLVTILGEDFLKFGAEFHNPCGNCDGGYSGFKSAYAGVYGGECFQCTGTGRGRLVGTEEQAIKVAKKRIYSREYAERKRQEAEIALAAATAAWRAEHADLCAELLAIHTEYYRVQDHRDDKAVWQHRESVEKIWGGSTYIIDLASASGYRPLTDKEVTEVTKAIAAAKNRWAAIQTRQNAARYLGAKGDKVAATGTIVVSTTIEVESYTGYGVDLKRLVIIEGTGEFTGVTFKIISTAKAIWETERGQSVTLAGTVKRHADYDGTKQTELTYAKVKAA